MQPRFTSLVAPLPSTVPFVGPEAQERARGVAFRARLGANESVFGPSPKAVAAMRQAAAECWMYCDPENYDLKTALAQEFGLSPANIVVGEGIDSLFGYTVRMFTEPGDAVVSSLGAYPTFNFHVAGYGGRLVTAPYDDDREDPASLIEAVRRERPKLVFFANPDNPMGSWWPADAVQALIDAVPMDTVLVLDEAYIEFAPPGTAPRLDVSRPNVIRYRTFSKAYGMAGARIAYAIAAESVAKSFDKIRNHFSVNRIAQAGALAALADKAHLASVLDKVARSRETIGAIARANRLVPLASATNFVTIDCGRDGAHAKRVLDGLIAQGVFVRMPGVAPLNRCIRVSAGTEADLAVFAEALPKVLGDRAAKSVRSIVVDGP
jgi:histidinol-phosphate aminotransferase